MSKILKHTICKHKNIRISLILPLFLSLIPSITVSITGCQEKEVTTDGPNGLLSVISDKRVSYKKLVRVVQKLGPVTESPKFWSDIANSSEYNKIHRRIAVVKLFRRHVRPGMRLSNLSQLLGNPTWIDDSTVNIVTVLRGYVALNNLSPGTVLLIHVFSETPGLGWFICLRVSGEINQNDFINTLSGQEVKQEVKDSQILEFGLATPDFSPTVWISGSVD